jgi:hypothetical protein
MEAYLKVKASAFGGSVQVVNSFYAGDLIFGRNLDMMVNSNIC